MSTEQLAAKEKFDELGLRWPKPADESLWGGR
jgi:hypothetical protein